MSRCTGARVLQSIGFISAVPSQKFISFVQPTPASYFRFLNSADFLHVTSMYLQSQYTALRLSFRSGLPFPRQFQQRDHSQLAELQIQPFPDVCPLQVYLSRLFEKKRKERYGRIAICRVLSRHRLSSRRFSPKD